MGRVLEELQLIAESLASRLGRSVAIDDPQLWLLVHTSHGGEAVDDHRVESIMQRTVGKVVADWSLGHGIATATAPVRVPANEEFGFISRVCVPVRCRGILLAYLWLLDADRSVTDADLKQAMEYADAAAEVLYRERFLGEIRRGRDRQLLRDLLGSDPAVRQEAAEQLAADDRLPVGAEAGVLAVRVRTAQEASRVSVDVALERVERRISPQRALWDGDRGAEGLMLVAGRRPLRADRLRAVADDLHAEILATVGGNAAVSIGVGPVVGSVALARESHEHARDTLRVATRVRGFAPVVAWDSLGIYRLLAGVPHDRLREDAVPAGLLRLLETDHSGVLSETLEIYLDEAGRAGAAIERLQVHRTSLYHRLNRIEEITGMSLANGADRLALHLGIKATRLLGDDPR